MKPLVIEIPILESNNSHDSKIKYVNVYSIVTLEPYRSFGSSSKTKITLSDSSTLFTTLDIDEMLNIKTVGEIEYSKSQNRNIDDIDVPLDSSALDQLISEESNELDDSEELIEVIEVQ